MRDRQHHTPRMLLMPEGPQALIEASFCTCECCCHLCMCTHSVLPLVYKVKYSFGCIGNLSEGVHMVYVPQTNTGIEKDSIAIPVCSYKHHKSHIHYFYHSQSFNKLVYIVC